MCIITYCSIKLYGKVNNEPNTGSSLSWDETILRFHAGSAFGTLDKLLPNVQTSSLKAKIERNTKTAENFTSGLIKNSFWVWLFIASGIVICYLVYTPAKDEPEPIETAITGTYTGNVQGTPSTIKLYENADGLMQADMTIDYQAGQTNQTMVAKEKDDSPLTLYLDTNDKITLTLTDNVYSDDVRTLEGTYVNSKGNTRRVLYKKIQK